MTLPAPVFPKSLFDGNEQDTSNDGASDPQKYQAGDYNELASEIQAVQLELRDGAILAVKNDSGSLINQGDNIRVVGFDPVSRLPRVVLASAASSSTLSDGVALQDVPNDDVGNIGKQFVLRDLNTQALGPAGTDLFLSTTPGAVTATPPTNAQPVGLVLRQSTTVGVILFEVGASLVTAHTIGGAAHSVDTLANLNSKISDANLDDSGNPRDPNAHTLGGAAHSADTLANLNSKVSDANLDDSGDPRDPSAHALGGAAHSADTLANLNSKISDATLDDTSGSRTPSAHALGGAAHSADTLANLNSKVSDANLDDAGDPRDPNAHALGGAAHSADTLANLNSKVSDATLDDSSSARTPTAHASAHEGGSDPVTVESLVTAELDQGKRLAPDGALGLTFADGPGFTIATAVTSGAITITLATIPLGTDEAVILVAHVVGRRTNGSDRAGYIRRAVGFRQGAAAAAIQGTVNSALTRESTGSWNATIAVSGNNLIVQVTGIAGHDINWRAEFFTAVGS